MTSPPPPPPHTGRTVQAARMSASKAHTANHGLSRVQAAHTSCFHWFLPHNLKLSDSGNFEMGGCPGLSERVQLGSAACSLEVPGSATCSLEVAGFRVNFKDLGTQTSPTLVWVPRVGFRA